MGGWVGGSWGGRCEELLSLLSMQKRVSHIQTDPVRQGRFYTRYSNCMVELLLWKTSALHN